jgi:hypothetical protein
MLFTFLLGPIGLLGYLILRRLAGQQNMESR